MVFWKAKRPRKQCAEWSHVKECQWRHRLRNPISANLEGRDASENIRTERSWFPRGGMRNVVNVPCLLTTRNVAVWRQISCHWYCLRFAVDVLMQKRRTEIQSFQESWGIHSQNGSQIVQSQGGELKNSYAAELVVCNSWCFVVVLLKKSGQQSRHLVQYWSQKIWRCQANGQSFVRHKHHKYLKYISIGDPHVRLPEYHQQS